MHYFSKFFSALVWLFFILSCKNNSEENIISSSSNVISFLDQDFKTTEKARSTSLQKISDSLFNIGKIVCSNDYIVINDFANSNPLHIINRYSGKYIGKFGDLGKGPGEILMPWGLSVPKENFIEVFDMQQGKIISFNIDSLILSGRHLKEYRFDKSKNNINSALTLNDNIYITSETDIKHRLYEISLSEKGDENIGHGTIPKKKSDIPNHIHASAYIANMQMKNNVFVFNYLNTPLVQVINLNSKKEFFLSGPETFSPIYKIDYKPHPMYMFTKESRLGYTDIKIYGNYIYSL